jgi:pyrimidine oxygenase
LGAVATPWRARAQGAFMTQAVVGAPDTCAQQIETFLRDCDIDGLMFIYDDYACGIAATGAQILPRLRKAFA